MAISGQPNSWTCGPFALRHALLAHGVFAPADELTRLAGSTEAWGTDEPEMRRAARAYGVDMRIERTSSASEARHGIERRLQQGLPVLLCVDQWEHWLTAVAADADHVVVFDSKYDAPLRLEPWGPLIERLACRHVQLRGFWSRTLYDLHPIVPRRPTGLTLALTPPRARHLMREENAALAVSWDEYARALQPLCRTPGPRAELRFDLERYIATRRGPILDLVVRAGTGVPSAPDGRRAAAARVVDDLSFAAGLYQGALLPELEPGAVPRLAQIVGAFLTRRAATEPATIRTSAAA